MTRRLHVDVPAPALGGAGTVIVHGHYGRPFLVFPSERGRAWDFENNGMVAAVGPPVRVVPAGGGPPRGLRKRGRAGPGPPAARRRPGHSFLGHPTPRGLWLHAPAVEGGAAPPARRVRAVDRRLGAAVPLGRLRR